MEIRTMYAPDLHRGFLESLSSLGEVNLTPDEAAAVFQRRLGSKVQTYVAEIADRVVGTATLIVEQKYLHQGGLVGHVEDVAVHRDYQHQRIGHALMAHVIQEGRRRGCYKLILDCKSDLIPYYERLGFKIWQNSMRLDLAVASSPAPAEAAFDELRESHSQTRVSPIAQSV